MIKKLCAIFLAICIVATTVLGVGISCSRSQIQETITVCDMEPEIFLC